MADRCILHALHATHRPADGPLPASMQRCCLLPLRRACRSRHLCQKHRSPAAWPAAPAAGMARHRRAGQEHACSCSPAGLSWKAPSAGVPGGTRGRLVPAAIPCPLPSPPTSLHLRVVDNQAELLPPLGVLRIVHHLCRPGRAAVGGSMRQLGLGRQVHEGRAAQHARHPAQPGTAIAPAGRTCVRTFWRSRTDSSTYGSAGAAGGCWRRLAPGSATA